MLRLALTLAVLVAALSLTACEDDVVGPPGPPGNANVRAYTFTFTPRSAQINDAVASVQYEVPAITPLVVDEGAVLMYFRDQGTWTAMPYTFGVESADLPAVDYTVTLGFGYDDRFLEVFLEASTLAVDLRDFEDYTVRAVIIDGFFAAKNGIDWTDYEAVRAHFDLPE